MLQVQKGSATDAQQRMGSRGVRWLRRWKEPPSKKRRVTLRPDAASVRPLLARLKPLRLEDALLPQCNTARKLYLSLCHQSHPSGAVPPFTQLRFSSERCVFHPVELLAWHKQPQGKEQQAMGTEQRGLLGKPSATEGNPSRADEPPKVFWFLPHKLQRWIDVTVFYCKLNNCARYAAVLRILTNCGRFCFLSSMSMTCSLDRTCKKEANLKPEWM